MNTSSNIYYPEDETERLFIKSIWRLQEFDLYERTETILPKGTAEIIFNMSGNIAYRNPYTNVDQALPSCFINGINLRPFELRKSGPQYFIGVQLDAIGLKGLLNSDVTALCDSVTNGPDVCRSLELLSHRLFLETTFEGQVESIRRWLWDKISVSKHRQTIRLVDYLFRDPYPSHYSVSELSREKGISDRQLRRVSAAWLGMNTETHVSYRKYLTALHLLHNTNLSLTHIGLDAGYYDQSHFIRDFRSFTGLTPKAYRTSVTTLPGHIVG
jgi:AraC-like DNA-binding protein